MIHNQLLYHIIIGINLISLVYIISISAIYFCQLIASTFGMKRYIRTQKHVDYQRFTESENMVPISLLVPAYNEAATIIDSVNNLLALDFPEYEVIVINDGSRDNTLQLLIEEYALIPLQQPYKRTLKTQPIKTIYRSSKNIRLVVIDKENGGKADALNAGINLSFYPIFVSIDADSLLEKDSLAKIIYTFLIDPDCIAVGGIVRVVSGCEVVDGDLKKIDISENPLVALQTTEYLRAFLTGRMGFDYFHMLLIISGAFGAFNKKVVIDAGGYACGCIGEDMELVVRLHKLLRKKKQKYTVRFLPDPVCWTLPPDSVNDLKKQRKRWQMGLIGSLLRHKDMLLNPAYGRIGMVCLPYYWLFEMIGPLVETFGYIFVPISWLIGVVSWKFMLSFFCVAVLYGTVLSVGALLLEEKTFKKYPDLKQLAHLFFYAVIDNFGYRQLNTIYRVLATFGYYKNKEKWGDMKRRSFAEKKEETTVNH